MAYEQALVEWNDIKDNEEVVKEKTEEYLESFNQSESNNEQQQTRQTRRHEEEEEEEHEGEEEPEEEEEVVPKKRNWAKRRRKLVVDDELIENPNDLTIVNGTPLEPLTKQKRLPAQERAFKELSSINERIASLVQVRQMGLATEENKKQLKQLMKDRKKKGFELKRLQCKQRASNKYRSKKKKIVRSPSLSSLCED